MSGVSEDRRTVPLLLRRARSGDVMAIDELCLWVASALGGWAEGVIRNEPRLSARGLEASDLLNELFLELRDYLTEDPARTPRFRFRLVALAKTMLRRWVSDWVRAERGQGEVKRVFVPLPEDHSVLRRTSFLSLFRERLGVRELITTVDEPHRSILAICLEHIDDPAARDAAIVALLGLPNRRAAARPLRLALDRLESRYERDDQNGKGLVAGV